MVVDGKLYIGLVKEKTAAEEEYETAKNEGLNTGMVSQQGEHSQGPRDMDVFQIAINVAPNSSAEFRLSYKQLLERRNGFYEQTISIRPKQIVPSLKVAIDIEEPQTLSNVDVMKIRKDPSDALEKGNPIAVVTNKTPQSVHIEYSPSEDEQKREGFEGVDGDFIVRYDVHHGSDAGVIQVLGNYFVHFFSPSGLSPLAKNVVFVIDISFSMYGRKIEQTRQAMFTILDQLRAGDSFNIVLFKSDIIHWKHDASPVTSGSIQAAKTFVNEYALANGKTNINDALLLALKLLKNTVEQPSSAFAGNFPMVLFLTDGDPTEGVTDTFTIRANVLTGNELKASIFALGFGFNFDFDFDFLKALSAENGGTARRIYPEKDAETQLEGFFEEISTPLLQQIRFEYSHDVVDAGYTTTQSFAQYYNGSELVVGGKLKESVSLRLMSANIRSNARNNPVTFSVSRTLLDLTVPSDEVLIKDFTERLWAYMKIKEILLQLLMSNDTTEKARLKTKALRMSLQYNFVTPLTSLIVVQSNSYLESGRGSENNVIVYSSYTMSVGWKISSAEVPPFTIFFFFVRFCVN